MSKALYRKYRSKTLDEIVGQEHVTTILSSALKAGRIGHAYLFTGPRGVGKTSIARILAHEINQLPYDEAAQHLDIIEIDAASNNGVEDVRDLREKVQIAPVSAPKKIYIIDEVHMLSKQAFNALLKTLEEPPEHVVFILATTDADKLPATIISRVQQFGFRAISPSDAVKHLRFIADKEKIVIDNEALQLIAERGDGSFRDSIGLLDQLATLADGAQGISAELVEKTLGLAPKDLLEQLVTLSQSNDLAGLVALLDTAKEQGLQSSVLASQLVRYIRAGIAQKPQLLPLLDALLEVPKSSQSDLKLLTTLARGMGTKQPKTVALAAPVHEVSATIAELEQLAGTHKPAEPAKKQAKVAPKTPPARAELATPRPTKKPTAPSAPLDWKALIDYTHTHHVALYSVLSKCGHELQETNLTLYTMNTFYKKKLDDTKYLTLLYESLQNLGVYGLDIHTIPTAPPPQDSQAAAVAAIMGGGEEVSVEV